MLPDIRDLFFYYRLQNSFFLSRASDERSYKNKHSKRSGRLSAFNYFIQFTVAKHSGRNIDLPPFNYWATRGRKKKKLDERYISACRQNIRSKPAQDRAMHKPVSAARATKRTVRCICHPPLKQLLLNIRAVPRIVCQQSHSRWKSSLSAVRRQFPRA